MLPIIIKIFVTIGAFLAIIHISLTINCNEKPIRIPLKQCCQIPSLISKPVSQVCKKYKVQTQMPDGNNNKTILRNQREKHRRLAWCYMECIFNETGIIQNNDLQLDKVKTHLATVLANKTGFLSITHEAVGTCSNKVKEMIEKMSANAAILPPSPQLNDSSVPQCSPHSNMIMNCVISELFLNCPNSSWTNSTNCVNMRDFMASCPHNGPHYGPPRN